MDDKGRKKNGNGAKRSQSTSSNEGNQPPPKKSSTNNEPSEYSSEDEAGVLSDDCIVNHPIIPATPTQDSTQDPAQEFQHHENKEATKLFLSSQDKETKLRDLNPLAFRKSLNSLAGPVALYQFIQSGNAFVTCTSNDQLQVLLRIEELKVNEKVIPVKFAIAKNELSVQGKIYAQNLIDAELEEILEELKDQKVIKVEKLLKDPTKANVPLFLLTFSGPTCPEKVVIAYHRYKVDLAIPNSFKCQNCLLWGHSKTFCNNKTPRCAKCSEKGHNINDCKSTITKCFHCSGKHQAFDRECQVTKDQKEIQRIKFTNNISYKEARNMYYHNDQEEPSFSQNSFNNTDYQSSFPETFSQSQPQVNPTQNSVWNQPNNIRRTTQAKPTTSPVAQARPSTSSSSYGSSNSQQHHHAQISKTKTSQVQNRNSYQDFRELLDQMKEETREQIASTIISLLPILFKFILSNDNKSKVNCVKELGSTLKIDSTINALLVEYPSLVNNA